MTNTVWTAVASLTGTETLVEYGTLVEPPTALFQDGLVILDFGASGWDILHLDAEVLIEL